MKYALLSLVLLLAPWAWAQTVTRAWNEPVLMNYNGEAGCMSIGGPMNSGYEFEVLTGSDIPEVVELGCALGTTQDLASRQATATATNPNWIVTGGTAKVCLWEVITPTTGTLVAAADVPVVKTDLYAIPPTPNWKFVTLAQPVTLTPGKRYRVVVTNRVIYQTWDGSTLVSTSTTTPQIYCIHHVSHAALTQPTGPIKFTETVEFDNGTWPPSADASMYPASTSGGFAYPWGMADIGWRKIEAAPVLAAPTVADNTPGVLITEAGPDVATGGREGGELQNVSDRWIDISGWKIAVYDATEAAAMALPAESPVAIGTIPSGTALAPGQAFTWGETGASGLFTLTFGTWSWATSSYSAVVLLDGANKVVDVMRVNNFNIAGVTNPAVIPAAEWTGSYLSSWSTTQSWQRSGNSDSNTTTGWTKTTISLGTPNSQMTVPFPGAGAKYAALGGSDPNFTGQLSVGDKLAITFKATDQNSGDNMTLTVSAISGLDPVVAGFTGLTATTPAVANGVNTAQVVLGGTAAQAGTLTLRIFVTDSTSRTDTYNYTLTIAAVANFTPSLVISYDTGSGRQNIVDGATFGTASQPVTFGVALSSYAFQINVLDGNSDSVGVSASLQLSPASAVQGMTGADWEHAAQAASYMYSPNGSALLAHLNSIQCTFTLTLTANDGKGGIRNFGINFLVAARPANSAPAITVKNGATTVAQNGYVVVKPNDAMSGLGLQITVNDADANPVRLIGTVSNVTTQGIAASEFSSGGYLAVSYNLTPSSGVFNVPAVIHRVDLTADDNKWQGTSVFTFYFAVNRAPTLSVTAGSLPVSGGGSLAVNYLDTLASLGLSITVDDPDGNLTSVAATVSGVTTQGFSAADFSSAPQAVSYNIVPANGTFDDVAGSTHNITLIATDQYGGQANFSFSINANPFAPQIAVSEAGGATIANGDPATGGRDFGSQNISAGQSAALMIEIANIGSGPLAIQSVALSGPNASDFVLVAAGLPGNVLPATPYTFTLSFDPAAKGLKQATVSIQYVTTASALTFTFELQGNGQDAAGVSITTSTLPSTLSDAPYPTTQLGATGGTPAYTWSLFSGQLPQGLALDAQGRISGIVNISAQGTYTFTVRVIDANGGTDERQMSIDVTANPVSIIGGGSGAGGGGCQSGDGICCAVLALFLLAFGALLRRRTA